MTLMPITRRAHATSEIQRHPGRRMTEEEFVAWVRPKTRAEWVDGEVIIMAPDSNEHSRLVLFLGRLLAIVAEETDAGTTRGPEFTVRFGPQRRRRLPDILFISKPRMDLIRPYHLEGAPDLIFEVVSHESVDRDYRDKFEEYAAADVKEYWVADPLRRRLTAYSLTRSKRFRPVRPTAGLLRSKVLPRFGLKSEWLFPHPTRTIDVLRELGVL